MATKYILDPSGNIKKIVDKYVDEDGTIVFKKNSLVVDRELEYLKEVNQNISNKEDDNAGETFDNFLTNVQLGLLEGSGDSEKFKDFITTKINHDPSFGFIDPDNPLKADYTQPKELLDRSFKPFNSFTDTDRVFADEFEILTGYRLRKNELEESASTSLLMFTYLAEVIAKIAAVEAFVVVNQLVDSSKQSLEFRSANTKLRLGKYDFTEYDIFTKYIFNVLNYPHESSNTFERIMAYFIGFTEWLAPDIPIDLNEFYKIKNLDNSLEFSSKTFFDVERRFNDDKGFFINSLKSIGDTAIVAVTSTLQNTIATSLNHTSLNRVKLLLRKFYQERLFKEENLYSAKQKDNYVFGFFDDLNYYYFKFMIERMQVGLPFLKKYFYNKGYYTSKQESAKTRVSAGRYEESYNVNLIGTSYKWFSRPKSIGGRYNSSTRITGIPQLLHQNSDFLKTLVFKNKNIENFELNEHLAQNFYPSKDRKLPIEAVNELEKELEKEYMPFYIHDLRTNEVLAFHAFIESISDSFSPDYNPTSGFGRIDDVRTYTKTTRSINLTFILAATCKLDHDMMWYQINKIVSMCYPQWSNGYMANVSSGFKYEEDGEETFDAKFPFRYPFTQVPTASPLIRLRVGDVIKSNYSRTSLARLHGIGEDPVFTSDNFNYGKTAEGRQKIEVIRNLEAVNEQLLLQRSSLSKEILSAEKNSKEQLKAKNYDDIKDSKFKERTKVLKEKEKELEKEFNKEVKKIREKQNKAKYFLDQKWWSENVNDYDDIGEEGFDPVEQSKEYRVDYLPKKETYPYPTVGMEPNSPENTILKLESKIGKLKQKLYYDKLAAKREIKKIIAAEVKKEQIQDSISATNAINRSINAQKNKNDVEDYNSLIKEQKKNIDESNTDFKKNYNAGVNNVSDKLKKELFDKIINPEIDGKVNNPITISYESGMSKGLAGFMTSLNISYNESTWEIKEGSKAPMLVKIDFAFSPIHDIPPGLDHNGMMRAPTYNVGQINKSFFGDPNDRD